MKLSLVSIEREGFVRVALDGNLVAGTFNTADNNPMQNLLGQTWFNNRVVLDMQKCEYMDSCAIGWLMACHKGFRDNGGKMVLHSVQPRVKQLLDLLRIGTIISLASDEPSAKALVTQGGAK